MRERSGSCCATVHPGQVSVPSGRELSSSLLLASSALAEPQASTSRAAFARTKEPPVESMRESMQGGVCKRATSRWFFSYKHI